MATSASSVKSNETLKRTCIACGTEIPKGAYLCPTCKHAYCSVCNKPIEVARSTGLCQTKECEHYTKPVCNDCMVFDFHHTQSDIDFKLPYGYRDEQRLQSFWKRYGRSYRLASIIKFTTYLLVGSYMTLWGVGVLVDFLKFGISIKFGQFVAALVCIYFAAVWLFESDFWSPFRSILSPGIAVEDVCPACHKLLRNRPVRRRDSYYLLKLIGPVKFISHPDSLFELRWAKKEYLMVSLHFSHPIVAGESTEFIKYGTNGKIHELPSSSAIVFHGYLLQISLPFIDQESISDQVSRPVRICYIPPDTVRSQLTGQPNDPITDLVLPYRKPSILPDSVAKSC